MAVFYLAKKDGCPIGIYSTVDKARAISTEYDELEVEVDDKNPILYYADAVYSTLTMINEIPESIDIIIGPVLNQSADESISQLYKMAQKRRWTCCSLSSFYCFEIDKTYASNYLEQRETLTYKPWEFVNWGKTPNCKSDLLIKSKWSSMQNGKPFNLDDLTFRDIIETLAASNECVDLHSSFNWFTKNLLIEKFVDMANNNTTIYALMNRKFPHSFASVQYETVGYMCFFEKNVFDDIQKKSKKGFKAKKIKISSVLNTFIKKPEYGIFFAISINEERFSFINKDIVEEIYQSERLRCKRKSHLIPLQISAKKSCLVCRQMNL